MQNRILEELIPEDNMEFWQKMHELYNGLVSNDMLLCSIQSKFYISIHYIFEIILNLVHQMLYNGCVLEDRHSAWFSSYWSLMI